MAPPPGTWRSTPKAAEHAAKYNLNILPDDFEYTKEELNLLKMYDTVKLYEREATRLKEKKARERIYANNLHADDDNEEERKTSVDAAGGMTTNFDDQKPGSSLSPKSSQQGTRRTKKKKKKSQMMTGMMDDNMSDDESDMDSVGSGGDHASDDMETTQKIKKIEKKTEEELRNELLATTEETFEPVFKKQRKEDGPQDGKSLITNLMNAKTPPHDFSEKLGLKSWKGTVLFPVTPDEPTWTPPKEASNPNDGAFVVPMEGFDITAAQNGEGPNTLALKFTAPVDSKRFSFNIAGPGHNDFDSILFHFNPRQRQKGGQLVINDKQKGVWGRAVQLQLSQIPLIFGQTSVTLLVQINGDGFDIFLEGKHCARLEHRTELPSRPCTLYLQFPSCDDYGSPENWMVYKAWWGNRESLIKDDVSGIAGVNTFDSVHPRKVFISGLPKIRNEREVELRRAELERAFHKYGGARGVNCIVPKHSSYAFVEFETERQCDHAMEEMVGKFPYKISRARRSKHEALMDQRAAEEAAKSGHSKESGDW